MGSAGPRQQLPLSDTEHRSVALDYVVVDRVLGACQILEVSKSVILVSIGALKAGTGRSDEGTWHEGGLARTNPEHQLVRSWEQ